MNGMRRLGKSHTRSSEAEWLLSGATSSPTLTNAKVGSHDQAATVHVSMVYSMVKNHKIDWSKLIYDDQLNKLRLPSSTSKRKQRESTVLYPCFLTGVIHLRYSDEDTYPPGNLSYSKLGHTLLNNKKQSTTDVRLRHVIHPSLTLSLTAEPSGMYSIIFSKPLSFISIAKTVTNPSMSSPAISSPQRKRPSPSIVSSPPKAKRTKTLWKAGTAGMSNKHHYDSNHPILKTS